MPPFKLVNGEWQVLTVTPSGDQEYVPVRSLSPEAATFMAEVYVSFRDTPEGGEFINRGGFSRPTATVLLETQSIQTATEEGRFPSEEPPPPPAEEPTTKTFTVLDALGNQIEVTVGLEDVDEFGNAHKVYFDKDGVPLWVDTIRVDGQFQRTMLKSPEERPDPDTVGQFIPVEGLPGFGIVTLPDGTPRLVERPEAVDPKDVGKLVPIEGLPGFGMLTLPNGDIRVVDIAGAEEGAAERARAVKEEKDFPTGIPFPIGQTGTSFVRLPDGSYAFLPERDVPTLPEQQAQAFLDGDLDKVRQITAILNQPRTMEQLVTSLFASGNDARARELLGIMNAPTQREVFTAIASKFQTAFGVAQFASVFGATGGINMENAMAHAALGDLGIGVKEAVTSAAPDLAKRVDTDPEGERTRLVEREAEVKTVREGGDITGLGEEEVRERIRKETLRDVGGPNADRIRALMEAAKGATTLSEFMAFKNAARSLLNIPAGPDLGPAQNTALLDLFGGIPPKFSGVTTDDPLFGDLAGADAAVKAAGFIPAPRLGAAPAGPPTTALARQGEVPRSIGDFLTSTTSQAIPQDVLERFRQQATSPGGLSAADVQRTRPRSPFAGGPLSFGIAPTGGRQRVPQSTPSMSRSILPGEGPHIPEGPGGSALTVPAAPLGAVQADLTKVGRALTGREVSPFDPAKLFQEAGIKFGVAGKFRAPSQSQLAKLSPREQALLRDKLSAVGISGTELERASAATTPGSFNQRAPRARLAPRGIR